MNHWKRAGHVVNVLLKHGMGYFVHELGLKWHLPLLKKLTAGGKPPKDLPVRLRKIMEQLGGAYLKLGQFLALRPDLLPREYCDEFRKLLDEVRPMPFSKVEKIIEANIKEHPRKFFSHIYEKPVGSASVAQVHRAKLKNGKQVVIKVQRPEAKENFASDIKIMYYLAHKIQRRYSNAIDPVTIVKEFERYTQQELNFMLEARNIDRFAKHFSRSKVVIPDVYWPATTSQVLTMDHLEGKKLTDVIAEDGKHPALAKQVADASFEQVLKLGAFHADMHPGNILVLPGNKIALIDFGIVGNLSPTLLKQTVAIYAGLVSRDAQAVANVLLKVGTPESNADIEDLRRDVEHIVNSWYGTELSESRVTQMLQELFESCARHNVTLPVNLILLGKALVTVEGTCLALDPGFNFVEYSQPKISKLLRAQKHPTMLVRRFKALSKDYATLVSDLPEQASAVMERIRRGSVSLNLKDTDVKHIGMDLNRSSNRLSYALIIASLLVTAALLIEVPPKIGAYSIFTVVGLVFAFTLLAVLLVSVLREGRTPFDPHKDIKR